MPKTSTKKPNTTNSNTSSNVIDNATLEAIINQNKTLMQQNADLQEAIKKLLEAPVRTEVVEKAPEATDYISYEEETEEYPEPAANKQIKLISLTYGKLNLASAKGSEARKVRFTEYGQVRNVLYSTLIDIVNTNPTFAENGMFYIADKNAVYHLGLTAAYKKIQAQNVLDNICAYDEGTMKSIYDGLSKVQQDNCIYGIVLRLSRGENFDANKIDSLNRIANVDIRAKVDELKKAPQL